MSCHQCHRNVNRKVLQCKQCYKRYCIHCVTTWYPKLEEALFEEKCPSCDESCNCGACLQLVGPSNIQYMNGRLEETYDLSAHIINVLLPSLKKHLEEAETKDDEVLNLVMRAEAIVKLYENTLETRCSCRTREAHNKNSIEAAFREEGSENYLFCPAATENYSDLRHFQAHLANGQPVIVSRVLRTNGLSWEPSVMRRAICNALRRDSKSMDFSVINCEEKMGILNFFNGYSNGLFDHQGHPKVLKLEVGSSKPFREQLQGHYREVLKCLPFKPYTHSVSDSGSVSVQMSVSYGLHGGMESITKLQYDVFDRVSILVHVVSNAPEMNKGQLPVSSNILRGLEDFKVGTVWDIFRKQDVPKLEEYLNKHAEEMNHIFPLHQMVHPDHRNSVYLTTEHKQKLKDEYGIEPWTFMQTLGDAVFVPAGCFYQMRNLKSCIHVAVDFMSPESLSKTESLFEGRRFRPSDDFLKEHKLKMKKVLLDTVTQAVRKCENIPRLGEETCSAGFMIRQVKMMRLLLERAGDKVPPAKRNMLEVEFQNFINSCSRIL